MEDSLRDFIIGVVAFEIGLLLFFLRIKKPEIKKFVDSMTVLLLFMTLTTLTIPLLSEHRGYMYYFLPIFLFSLNGWLFFTKKFIFGKIQWQNEVSYYGVRNVWFLLIAGFFVMTICLVVFIPQVPKWSLP